MPHELLEPSQMISQLVEPKRKFRWILQYGGIDAYTLKTAQRPNMAFEDTVIDYMNNKLYFAGKGTWEPITITLYDPIAPSAAQKVRDWLQLVWENVQGRMGYKDFYAKNLNLKLLGPDGAVAEDWEILKCWPLEVNYGELDYASSDPVEISITLRFDQAVLLH